MQHLLWMILWDESPSSSGGGGQVKAIGFLGSLTETSKKVTNAASVWHEYCSDAMCPTLMDWQAR